MDAKLTYRIHTGHEIEQLLLDLPGHPISQKHSAHYQLLHDLRRDRSARAWRWLVDRLRRAEQAPDLDHGWTIRRLRKIDHRGRQRYGADEWTKAKAAQIE